MQKKKNNRRRPARGFSLLEIMIVITLIGLVTAAVGVAVMGQFTKGQIDNTRNQAMALNQTIDLYKLQVGSYPKDIDSLVSPPRGKPLVERKPVDSWGNDFVLTVPGVKNPGKFDVRSRGPDGELDTEDDVGNWPEEAAAK
jgi:general secretion pathway protein G